MQATRNPVIALRALWRMLSPRRRIQLYMLLAIMISASFAEVFSLGLIVPFLAVLTAPDKVMHYAWVASAVRGLGIASSGELVLWLGAAFCVATLAAAAVRLLLLYTSTGLAHAIGADLSNEVYRRALCQPYIEHLRRNSSDVIDNVIGKANVVSANVIGQILTIISSVFLISGVVSALVTIAPQMTLIAVAAFILVYGLIIWTTRERIKQDSLVMARESPKVVKALQEGLGGIRDVIIDGSQDVFTEIYRSADRKVRAAQGRILLTSGSPRFLIEGLGMVFIALIAILSTRAGSGGEAIAVLGALALGAQRLLPVIQQTYAAIITIRASEASLWDVIDMVQDSAPASIPRKTASPWIVFQHDLKLSSVGFSYSPTGQPLVLSGVNLRIAKGTRVGIAGPTGGGKSTLMDLVMGLLEPTEGELLVDEIPIDEATRRNWQDHIAHVPQAIFLSDATIAENIAFGRRPNEIDMARVQRAARLAQIAPTIEGWPQGYQTLIGERGARLSGGQRQRLGVARALYKEADVIIFDEATSALDSETESDLMSAIDTLSRDLTLIMVAHRTSTLRNCDVLFRVEGGKVREVKFSDIDPEADIEREAH